MMTRSPEGRTLIVRVCCKNHVSKRSKKGGGIRERQRVSKRRGAHLGHLLRDQGRYRRFECSRSDSHDDDRDHETTERSVWIDDDHRNTRDNEQDVADDCDSDGVADRLVSSEVRVGNVRTKQRTDVDPEAARRVNIFVVPQKVD